MGMKNGRVGPMDMCLVHILLWVCKLIGWIFTHAVCRCCSFKKKKKTCWCCYGASTSSEKAEWLQTCSENAEMQSNRCSTNGWDIGDQNRETVREEAPRTGFMEPPGVRSLLDPNTCPEPPHSRCWFVPFTFFFLVSDTNNLQLPTAETPTVAPYNHNN